MLDPSACLERFTTTPEDTDQADTGDTEAVVVDLPVGGDNQPTKSDGQPSTGSCCKACLLAVRIPLGGEANGW